MRKEQHPIQKPKGIPERTNPKEYKDTLKIKITRPKNKDKLFKAVRRGRNKV